MRGSGAAGAAGVAAAVALEAPNGLALAALRAHERIRPYVLRTPLLRSHWLSSVGGAGCSAAIKLESEQHTNSFKVRGALNKLLSLSPEEIAGGLVTCSTGNHALAFVHALGAVPGGGRAAGASRIYLPHTASAAKVAKLRAQGAHVVLFGNDCVDAEREARRVAEQEGGTYLSPYNDAQVMAGQGTVAVELLEEVQPDVVIVPVGGGGLIGGVAAVVKAAWPACVVVGAQPANSDVMRQSVEAGRIVDAPSLETLSDATAGGIEEGAVTLAPCTAYVDDWVAVSEQEIADAMVSFLTHHSKLVEGAAGCGLAAFRRLAADGGLAGRCVVVVACGGNVAPAVLSRVLQEGRPWAGR